MRIYSLNRLENIRDNTDIIMQRLRDIKPKKKNQRKSIAKKQKNGTKALPESKNDVTAAAVEEEKDYEDDFHESSNDEDIQKEIIDEIPDETMPDHEKQVNITIHGQDMVPSSPPNELITEKDYKNETPEIKQ